MIKSRKERARKKAAKEATKATEMAAVKQAAADEAFAVDEAIQTAQMAARASTSSITKGATTTIRRIRCSHLRLQACNNPTPKSSIPQQQLDTGAANRSTGAMPEHLWSWNT